MICRICGKIPEYPEWDICLDCFDAEIIKQKQELKSKFEALMKDADVILDKWLLSLYPGPEAEALVRETNEKRKAMRKVE